MKFRILLLVAALMGLRTFAQNTNLFPTTGNAGVGTITPTEKFEVVGNTKVKGDLTVTNGDFKLKDLNDNSLTYDRVLGINPNGKAKTFSNILINTNNGVLDINGNIFSSGSITTNTLNVSGITAFTNTIRVSRISPLIGDTVIRLGDSTIYITSGNNRISFTPGFTYKGMSIGNGGSSAKGFNALALGMGVRVEPPISGGNAANAMAIGSGVINSNGNTIKYLINPTPNSLYLGFNSDLPTLFVGPANGSGTTGNVGIGMTNPLYKLDVCGVIRSKEVRVNLTGCDFVFENSYKLMPLEELENYIRENKHLPGMAPASQMETPDGVQLGEMNSKLLQKVEELTLYTIEQGKMIEDLKKRIEQLEK